MFPGQSNRKKACKESYLSGASVTHKRDEHLVVVGGDDLGAVVAVDGAGDTCQRRVFPGLKKMKNK